MEVDNFKEHSAKVRIAGPEDRDIIIRADAMTISSNGYMTPPINACKETMLPTPTRKATIIDDMIKAIGVVSSDKYSNHDDVTDSFIQEYVQSRQEYLQSKMEAEKARSLSESVSIDSMSAVFGRDIRDIKLAVSNTAPATSFVPTRLTGSIVIEDDTQSMLGIPSLDKVRLWALEHGYSLNKIEYESTDLSGTNKIKLKGE